MARKRRKMSMKNQIVFALKEIKEKYPAIMPSQIEMFSPIYYPIAMVEMNLDEMTFEDFETVQLTVLKLISLGQLEEEVLADLLGLSVGYISRVKHLLRGYGHIEDDKLTELGQESLLEEKKITRSQVWQKFQVDGLNGSLIRMSELVADNSLNDKDETRFIIGHLDYLDGIKSEEIEAQIEEGDYSDFIRQKTGILNTNVLAINDVECTEVKYAVCFLMKLKGVERPVIFAKRYNEEKKEVRERFSWQAFSIAGEDVREKYGFEENIPLSSQMAVDYTENIFQLIKERSQGVEIDKEIFNTLKKLYPFQREDISIEGSRGGNIPLVSVKRESLKKDTPWLKIFLEEIEKYGQYIITNEHLYGKMIAMECKD